MTQFRIRANAAVGGNLRASVSRESDDYVWDETTTTWVDPNGLGFIHDNSSVQMSAVAGRRGAYKCDFPFSSTYSGELVVRVHDSNQTDEVMDEKRFYSRGGNVVGTVIVGQDFLNQEIADAFVFTLSKRLDGTIAPDEDLTIGVTDTDLVFAMDTRMLYKHGINVAPVTVSSVTSTLSVTALGPQGQLAVFKVDGGQVAGDAYALESVITMDNPTSSQIRAPLTIVCN